MILEKIIEFNKQEQELLDFVCGVNFPWFFQKSTNKNLMFFGHTLMNRNSEELPIEGEINSELYKNFK